MTMNLAALKRRLQPAFEEFSQQTVAAYLFGSAVEDGSSGPLSDIDIAVLFSERDGGACFDLRLRLYTRLSTLLGRNDIDVLALNLSGNLVLMEEVVRKGKLLYETDREKRFDFETTILHRALDFKQQRLAILGE
jgi:predicted nucleotidyltransferase